MNSFCPFPTVATAVVAAVTALLLPNNMAWSQNDLTDIPEPDPAAEAAQMKLGEGSAVNLYASDPQIRKPIQMNFDSEGNLWVASSEVYPQIRPGEKANDKIVVLRDTDGDGEADERTVFAEGLLIPTGVVPDGPSACYVAESTQLIYLEDTDGDGRSDRKRVVFSGFGTEDTHHLLHTLRWGPDGCLYFNQSIYIHSHIETAYGTRHLDGGGIWRYRPTTGELDVFCKGFVNPWGHVFDRYGESFVTDGAFFEGINYAFPEAVFATSPGATRWIKGLNPGSPKHCGLEVLSGTHLPTEWRGDLVTNDFRSHRVCRFTVRPSGSGYVSRQQPELLTTEHVAFRPVDARMGPDGALYVADWYNPIIQHGEVDFRDERRDRSHGRVWRIAFPDRPLDRWPSFTSASVEELAKLLEDPALAVRQFARQQLWKRLANNPEAVMSTIRVWRDADGLDANSRALRALEVLWLNEVRESSNVNDARTAIEFAQASDGATLRPALRSVWRTRHRLAHDSSQRSATESLVLDHVDDDDPRARLESVVANGTLDTLPAVRRTLQAAGLPMDANLDFALWQAFRKQDDLWIPASLDGELTWLGRENVLAFAVSAVDKPQAAEIIVRLIEQRQLNLQQDPQVLSAAAMSADSGQLGRLLKALASGEEGRMTAAQLELLLERTEADGVVPRGAGEVLTTLVSDAQSLLQDPERARVLAGAAAAWKVEELEPILVNALDIAPDSLRDPLVAAIGALGTPSSQTTIDNLLQDDDPANRAAAVRALVANRPRAALEPLVELLSETETVAPAGELVVSLLQRKGIPGKLASTLANAELPAEVARQLLRRVRSAGGHAALEAAIREAGKLEDAAWKLSPELTRRIVQAARENGSPERGEAIYRLQDLQCISCHAIGGAGGLVGPNLISLGGSAQPDYILESLIDPNAKLKEGYTTRTVLTNQGKLISGIAIGQSDDTLNLRLADGSEVEIPLDSVADELTGKSLMPAGLVDTLTERDLVDLVAFLSQLGRNPEFSVSTEPLVRSFESLVYSNEANRRLNRTSTDTVATDDPAMNWRSTTTMVSGEIPLTELSKFKQHRDTPPTSFIRFSIEMTDDGSAVIDLPTRGIESWVDGRPTPVWELESLELEQGVHQVVLGIDRSEQSEPFSIQVAGDAVPATQGQAESPN